MELGVNAKDKITGFKGIAVGRASYITGCDQYLIQPPVKEDGGHQEGRWIDIGRLEIIGEGIEQDSILADKNGCDIAAPTK